MKKLKWPLISLLIFSTLLLVALWFQVTQPLFPITRIESFIEVDPARLETHIRILSERFIPRDHKHVANLDSVAAYIHREFERTDGKVSEQRYIVDSLEYRNIILQLGPETQERIIIGAHYDAAHEFPGADDNASGVAGMIELAQLLNDATLPMMFELIAYTLEEPPFFRTDYMGSAVHADALQEQGVPVRMMISLEMIGYFSNDANSQHFPLSILSLFYPTEGNWIAVIGDLGSGSEVRSIKAMMRRATDLPVYSFNAPPWLVPGIDWSDHLNYRNNGYPGVMITDTAYLRNKNYHTENDIPDHLDYVRMAMVVAGVYEAVLEIAKK